MKDTRTKLIHASAKLFAQKGFLGTSIRQICRAGGTNVSAVRYYFGDKYGLYLATVKYLMEQTNRQVLAVCTQPQAIASLPRARALEVLHQVLDCFVEMGFLRQNILLERIFTYAELEQSVEFRRVLLDETGRIRAVLLGLLQRLTGLAAHSAELVLLCHGVFAQANQSDFMRFAICHELHITHYTPQVCQQIKQLVWRNTCAILKTYEKRNKKK